MVEGEVVGVGVPLLGVEAGVPLLEEGVEELVGVGLPMGVVEQLFLRLPNLVQQFFLHVCHDADCVEATPSA